MYWLGKCENTGFKPPERYQSAENNMELHSVLLTTGASVGFFNLVNRGLGQFYVPETAQRNTWKWRNISTSFVHSLITGIWAVLWWVFSTHTLTLKQVLTCCFYTTLFTPSHPLMFIRWLLFFFLVFICIPRWQKTWLKHTPSSHMLWCVYQLVSAAGCKLDHMVSIHNTQKFILLT